MAFFSTITLTITIFIISAIWFLQNLLTKNTKSKSLPGPKSLPIIGHLHLILGQKPHHALHHLSHLHGPIMFLRLGLVPAVVISSPAAASLVLKTHDHTFASKPPHHASKHVCYDQRNLVFAPYGPYWRSMRKLITLHLLSPSQIHRFRPMRRTELGALVESLRRASENRETVNISKTVSALNGDMTCLMVFGRTYSDRDLDEKGFKSVVDESMRIAGLTNLADFFPFLGAIDPQGLTRRLKKVGKTYDRFLEKIIDDHGRSDFVDTLMEIMQSGEAEFEFDRRHVKAVLVDMILAGIDTSATAIEWVISELIKHPKCMAKLQEELERIVRMGEKVEESDLDKLEYLDLVVKETFRLHPVVPLLIHESIEDCTLDGHEVGRGTRLLVNLMSIGRDPKTWGLDYEEFVPERFVGSEVDLRGHDFQLIPFSSGRRGCPGMQLGLTVVRLVVAQLVHCFDWELPNGMLTSDLDMDEHFGLVTRRANNLMAIPRYRLME